MSKPLEAVVAALCMSVFSMWIAITSVREAQAVSKEQQRGNFIVHEQMIQMKDSVIRIDENVKFMKQRHNDYDKSIDFKVDAAVYSALKTKEIQR